MNSHSTQDHLVLVTGGLGFIGSHACVSLIEQGYDVAALDNLSNSKQSTLDRIEEITSTRPAFFNVDLRNQDRLAAVVDEVQPNCVMHFAAKKSVSESVEHPIRYYENNVTGTINLMHVMKSHDVKRMVFSSSATVYGDSEEVPIQESAPLQPTNPYGRSKLMNEQQLKDLYNADSSWEIMVLRYFNPIGAHPSGKIGEDPSGEPENLMPIVCDVATGKREKLQIFGDDYETPDGTGVRDYIHVMDLVEGHVLALKKMKEESGYNVYNLGTGQGYSVKEVVDTFEQATGTSIPYEITDRRPGDVGSSYSDPTRAEQQLDWQARRDLEDMCKDAWNWWCNSHQ